MDTPFRLREKVRVNIGTDSVAYGIIAKIVIEDTGTSYFVMFHPDMNWKEHKAEDFTRIIIKIGDMII